MGMGVLVLVGVLTRVTALNYMTIGDATVITYVTLVFALGLAHFVLKEPCLVTHTAMAFLIILGTMVLTRPPFLTGQSQFDTLLLIGVGLKLIDGASRALFSIVMRKMREFHFATVLLIMNLTGLVLNVATCYSLGLFRVPESLYDIMLLIGQGTLSSAGHLSLVLALKFEQVATVTDRKSVV